MVNINIGKVRIVSKSMSEITRVGPSYSMGIFSVGDFLIAIFIPSFIINPTTSPQSPADDPICFNCTALMMVFNGARKTTEWGLPYKVIYREQRLIPDTAWVYNR